MGDKDEALQQDQKVLELTDQVAQLQVRAMDM
jgi:hypothetical protein